MKLFEPSFRFTETDTILIGQVRSSGPVRSIPLEEVRSSEVGRVNAGKSILLGGVLLGGMYLAWVAMTGTVWPFPPST